jgi:hypothetical protein
MVSVQNRVAAAIVLACATSAAAGPDRSPAPPGSATAARRASAAPATPRPSILITSFIDDFGFASASFNRGADAPPETLTPNLDGLARDGVVLRRFHVHPFCSPSRASFMSGRLPVHVQQTNAQPDTPSAGVPFNMTSLPEFLRLAGAPVDAYVLGKYDVGSATLRHTPEGRGFNGSLIYFSHAIDAYKQTDYCGPGGGGCTCGDRFVDLWQDGAPASSLNGTAYADDLFLARALELIARHDYASNRTLWLHFNSHATHDPLQATAAMLAPLAYTTDDESFCNASVAASATGAVYPGAPTAPSSYACKYASQAPTPHSISAFTSSLPLAYSHLISLTNPLGPGPLVRPIRRPAHFRGNGAMGRQRIRAAASGNRGGWCVEH